MYVVWQLATPVVPVSARMQLPAGLKVTVPVGVLVVPVSVSVTVAVQVVAVPAVRLAGEHATEVDVERPLTVSPKPLEVEVMWVLSPP